MDSDYEHLVKFCKEKICDTKELHETCAYIKKNAPFFQNPDQKKFYTMCENILKDPYFKEHKEPEPPSYDEIQLLDAIDEGLKERGLCAIEFSEGTTHYLNMKLEIERFSYPFQRILAAGKHEHLRFACGQLFNHINYKDNSKYCYGVDFEKLGRVSYNQLLTVILATKIE